MRKVQRHKIVNNFVTDAINIKTYPLSENDNIVLMFSKQGLIKSVAKGVKKPKSKLGARMQALVANKILFRKGKNLDVVCQAQMLNSFNKLRYDFDKLTYGMYIAELVSVFCKENSNSEDIYDIFYKTLEKISEAETKKEILFNTLRFQLHFMKILGYGIDFKICMKCNKKIEDDAIFILSEGGILCKNCSTTYLNKINIPKKLCDFLSDLNEIRVEDKTKYDDLINEKICLTCFNLMKRYINGQSDIVFKTSKIIEENLI